MATRSPPSQWVTGLVFFGFFFGGGYGGIQLARALAPASGLAEFVSFLAFPGAFVIGLVAWAGAAMPAAIRRLAGLARKESGPASAARESPPRTIPPGSFAFVPVSLIVTVPAGVVVAALSTTWSFVWVACLYAALGLCFGVGCWRLARSGYLPFPKD